MGKAVLLIGAGLLIILAPVKFGLPIGFDTHELWTIGLIILFTLWLVWGIAGGRIRVRYSILDLFVLVFLLSAVISAVRAPNTHKAHLALSQYFGYGLIYFLVLNILEDERPFLGILITTAVFISLYAVHQFYIGLPETREFARQYMGELPEYVRQRLESNRVFGTFIYPNTLAGYLFLCIPLGFLVRRKPVRILAVLIMLYALYLTFYRGSGSADKIRNTLIFRWENWTAGFRMIKNYPLFGAGTYNFSVFYPIYKLDIAEEVQNAHNNFLQIFAEQGVIGFLAFCVIWIILLRKGGLILLPFIIHNLVDFDWYVPGLTVIAWVSAGILVWKSGSYKERVFRINRWLGLLIILPVFFFALLSLGRVFTAERYFKAAKEAFGRKDLLLSEVLARASMRMDKDNPEVYFLLGRISNDVSWYKKALEYNPYNSSYYYRIGFYKEAVRYYPTNPFYRLRLAQFYETEGQADLAVEEYRYALELSNKIEEEYKATGKMLRHLVLPQDTATEIMEKLTR